MDSRRDHIMEVDPVPGTILNPRLENIKGEKEDALVLAILDDPSRIPTFLWKRPSFLHKMQKVGFTDRKTEESLRKTNVYGSLPKSWPDVTREQVFKQLGIKDNTNEADARAIMAEECIAPDCFLSGGKNKKKRYGRL